MSLRQKNNNAVFCDALYVVFTTDRFEHRTTEFCSPIRS